MLETQIAFSTCQFILALTFCSSYLLTFPREEERDWSLLAFAPEGPATPPSMTLKRPVSSPTSRAVAIPSTTQEMSKQEGKPIVDGLLTPKIITTYF